MCVMSCSVIFGEDVRYTIYIHTCMHMSCIASFTRRKEEVKVTATVTEHSRTAKVIVFKKKRRKQYKRKRGMMIEVWMTIWGVGGIYGCG